MLNSPEKYLGELRPKNISDVFNAPDLFIGQIAREKGIIASRALLFLLIEDVVSFFNVGKTMNDKQVAVTCDLIIDYYPYFKPEDFKLCFRNAMLGKYGKQYDRLDGAIILEWLKCYDIERSNFAEEQSISEANMYNQKDNKIENGIFYKERIKSLENRASLGDKSAIEELKIAKEIQEKIFNL